MPLAKEFLAKLTRFYRRLKKRPNQTKRTHNKGTKYVKKCHKSCGTIPGVIELDDLDTEMLACDIHQFEAGKNVIIVKTKAEIVPEPRASIASHTITKERIAAGNEVSSDVGTQADGGPILENGISKRAFCRQLDNLLQRTLGADCNRTRVWTRPDSTFC
ncbi:hypothetical protein AWZ03_014639 [Drosophila navojoa]|uniref:Uncharacterized protein n=1 Tax=Drosophila navojoa TaxID=7232 RepID=A0A484AQT2_DRONA|nr:hypothetical protein AWZ03_014639 [Drosophila navojoa]